MKHLIIQMPQTPRGIVAEVDSGREALTSCSKSGRSTPECSNTMQHLSHAGHMLPVPTHVCGYVPPICTFRIRGIDAKVWIKPVSMRKPVQTHLVPLRIRLLPTTSHESVFLTTAKRGARPEA